MATQLPSPPLSGSISVQALEAALAEGLAMELAATLALAVARGKLCLSITVPPGVCALPWASHGTLHCARRLAHPFAAPSSGPSPGPPDRVDLAPPVPTSLSLPLFHPSSRPEHYPRLARST